VTKLHSSAGKERSSSAIQGMGSYGFANVPSQPLMGMAGFSVAVTPWGGMRGPNAAGTSRISGNPKVEFRRTMFPRTRRVAEDSATARRKKSWAGGGEEDGERRGGWLPISHAACAFTQELVLALKCFFERPFDTKLGTTINQRSSPIFYFPHNENALAQARRKGVHATHNKHNTMFSARFLLLACLLCLVLATMFPAGVDAKITYIKPLWQPIRYFPHIAPPCIARPLRAYVRLS
jgi:hypothetical protein